MLDAQSKDIAISLRTHSDFLSHASIVVFTVHNVLLDLSLN